MIHFTGKLPHKLKCSYNLPPPNQTQNKYLLMVESREGELPPNTHSKRLQFLWCRDHATVGMCTVQILATGSGQQTAATPFQSKLFFTNTTGRATGSLMTDRCKGFRGTSTDPVPPCTARG